MELNKDSVRLSLDEDTYSIIKFTTATIPLKITNLSKNIIPSTITSKNQTYLSYHIYENDKMVVPDGKRTRFEVDLLPGKEYVQGLSIDLPQKRGKYIIEIDLLTENKHWWGINKRCCLIIT